MVQRVARGRCRIERSVEFCLLDLGEEEGRANRGTRCIFLSRGGERKVRGKQPGVRNVSLCCGGICLRKYRLDRRRGSERADGWKQGECACAGRGGEGARRNDTDERTWEEEEGEGEGWRESEQGGGDARGDPRVR